MVNIGRLNRTFMELKYHKGASAPHPQQRLNRTFMELKLKKLLALTRGKVGLNRTFMELKSSKFYFIYTKTTG